jgi:hypothetical protein
VGSDDEIHSIFDPSYMNRYESTCKKGKHHSEFFTKKGMIAFFEANRYPWDDAEKCKDKKIDVQWKHAIDIEDSFYAKLKKKGTVFTTEWPMIWTRLIVQLKDEISS